MINILVTDGNNRSALAITRSLGKLNYKIFVGESTDKSLCASSRFCYKSFAYKDPNNYPDVFIEQISQYARTHSIDIIIPVSDITALLITKYKNSHFPDCEIPYPDYKNISLAADKNAVTNLAKANHIPVPDTITLNSANDLDSIYIPFPFPVVIKPSRSRVMNSGRWHHTAVSYAQTRDELATIISRKPRYEFPILIQERISGPGIGVFICMDKGKTIAHFSHRRLREKPPSGGVSVLRESVAVHPEAKVYAEKLLKLLGWRGVAMVEFKLDLNDNIPKLMEINGRFWGSLQLSIDAGVNFPYLIVNIAKQVDTIPVTHYIQGIKSRWFWGDVDALLLLLFKSSRQLNLPDNYGSRLDSIISFFKLWDRHTRYEVLRLEDFKPWVYETLKWFNLSK